jgi:broad specificity phosphatase PhoE
VYPSQRIDLVRHGETEWSRDRKHTSRTDVELTRTGERQARAVGESLRGRTYDLILVSPMKRAQRTCALAGWGDRAETLEDLREWDYGDYEGLTTPQIREHVPGWTVWTHGPKGGETLESVRARADRVIAVAAEGDGDVLLFGHGHMLRVIASRWIGLGVEGGARLRLETGTVSELGYERETRVILKWNA